MFLTGLVILSEAKNPERVREGWRGSFVAGLLRMTGQVKDVGLFLTRPAILSAAKNLERVRGRRRGSFVVGFPRMTGRDDS